MTQFGTLDDFCDTVLLFIPHEMYHARDFDKSLSIILGHATRDDDICFRIFFGERFDAFFNFEARPLSDGTRVDHQQVDPLWFFNFLIPQLQDFFSDSLGVILINFTAKGDERTFWQNSHLSDLFDLNILYLIYLDPASVDDQTETSPTPSLLSSQQ